MTETLSLAYSPCPNDTFIFYALVHGKVRVPGVEFREHLGDVETLNQMARESAPDITKISYHALAYLRKDYALLRSGGALGRGCGPLVVAKPGTTTDDLAAGVIAIPGRLTTAALLLRLYNPRIEQVAVMPFDRIMAAVSSGDCVAGLIIHESRFTYPAYNLAQLVDLGAWWEDYSGLPIPLGGIIGKRALGRGTLLAIEQGIRESLLYAWSHRDEVMDYCGRHSQEMSRAIMLQHIDLYVNPFSLDLGEDGLAAVRRFFVEAEKRNIVPGSGEPLLVE